jgi:hypothetical protein
MNLEEFEMRLLMVYVESSKFPDRVKAILNIKLQKPKRNSNYGNYDIKKIQFIETILSYLTLYSGGRELKSFDDHIIFEKSNGYQQ